MVLIVEDSDDVSGSVHSNRSDDYAIRVKEGARRLTVEESVFGGIKVESDRARVRLCENIFENDRGDAIRIENGGELNITGNVHGNIVVDHPDAEVKVRGNVHGDINVKQGRRVSCRNSIHGNVTIEDSNARVRLGTIYDNLSAETSDSLSCRKVYGNRDIRSKNTRKKKRKKKRMTDREIRSKKRRKKSKPTDQIYDKDLSSIESDKLAVWITASIANVQSTVKDVWLTDRAYQNMNLAKLLNKVDTVKKAKKLNTYNSTVNFTDKQIQQMENADQLTGETSERTIQDIIEHLADESYDELHNAILEFERKQNDSNEGGSDEKIEDKETENITAFEDI